MSPKGTSSRHRAREVALQTLYAIDLGRRPRRGDAAGAEERDVGGGAPVEGTIAAEMPGGTALDSTAVLDPAAALDRIAANFEAPPGARAFAWELVSQVCERVESLDLAIGACASNWRVSRMALVDRNVLRLGAYELAHTDTPSAIVLDEAVELARRYGSETSPAFVNGILDALARSLREAVA